MIADSYPIWGIIIAMGIGSFLIRFSFLGLVGDRKLPDWMLRHLRYTPVAVIPALIAPLVAWPAGAESHPDPVRLCAALVCFLVGYRTKSVLGAIIAGALTLIVGLQIA